jgi:predicted metal-dependent hydrolase
MLSQEIRSFPGQLQHLSYCLRRSPRRRSLALRVSDTGKIVVNAPQRLAQKEIDRFLQTHVEWVEARLALMRSNLFQWMDGAQLPWRGGYMSLSLMPIVHKPVLQLEADRLLCPAPAEAAAALVTQWYQQQARVLLSERLAIHATRAGLPLPPLRLTNARTRWGSLSPKGVVSLNWRLIKASPEQLDYVICHELAHFRQRNHSPAFWREVGVLFPEYARVRAQLRSAGHSYFEF